MVNGKVAFQSSSISGVSNNLYIDGNMKGPYGGPSRDIQIRNRTHTISFEPPPREILIDGKLCRLKFDGPTPVVIIDGKAHGIR